MKIGNAFRMFAITATFLLFVGCNAATDPSNQILRVRNVGTLPIAALRVSFPEASTEFGDIAAGATTP